MDTPPPTSEQAGEDYLRWYYNTDVWRRTTFLGIHSAKSVSDMWNYQEILSEIRPSLVVEFGTHMGGSTLYFANLLELVRPGGKVLTVDVDHSRVVDRVRAEPRIELLTSSSVEPRVAARIRELRAEHPGPLFVILDSDHTKQHVLGELRLLRDLVGRGDYVVVEDGVVNGHPLLPDYGEGPWEAIEAYEREHPDDYVHDRKREAKFGFTFSPRGFLVPQRERP